MRYFFLFFIACLFFCCDTKKEDKVNPFIYEYSGKNILSRDNIKIILEQDIDTSLIKSKLPKDLLTSSPSIEGRLSFKDSRVLVFTPKTPLKNGEEYAFTLHLDKLFGEVPEKYKTFNFICNVIPLNGIFTDNGISRNSKKLYDYSGSIESSDIIENNEVESWIKVDVDGTPMTLDWNHDGNVHNYAIHDIKAKSVSQKLTVKFYKPMENPDYVLEIPQADQFSVLRIIPMDLKSNGILIEMSEDLDPKQAVDGVISLNEIKNGERVAIGGVRYQKERNKLFVWFPHGTNYSHVEVILSKSFRSSNGFKFGKDISYMVEMTTEKPSVSFIGKGTIIADHGNVYIPFRAVALKAVDIEIIKVFNQNMNFFLQDKDYDSYGALRKTGRPIFQKKIDLTQYASTKSLNRWNDFKINLSNLINLEKGVVYRVIIRFKRSYTTMVCPDENESDVDYSDQSKWDKPYNYYEDEYYYDYDFDWQEKDNPCSNSYYNANHFIERDVINTSLGVLAKRGNDNKYLVAVTDLITTAPVSGCNVILYNYQNQAIDSAVTNGDGFAQLTIGQKGFTILAKKDDDKAWLKVADGNNLSLSNFDVSGEVVQHGLKGYIYGERDIWRPGDDLFLSFILDDTKNPLPEGHPIVASLINPQGVTTATRRSITGQCPIHSLRFQTKEEDPTGYWHLRIKVGGSVFNKPIRIEAIKPNRMSINMKIPENNVIGTGAISSIPVETRWLSGAPAPNRKAETEIYLTKSKTPFKEYSNYCFANTCEYFQPTTIELFKGKTNGSGNFSIILNEMDEVKEVPCMLSGVLTTRLYEDGGDFSISSARILYSPYKKYVGLCAPKEDDGWLSKNSENLFHGVILTPNGEKVLDKQNVKIEIYKVSWHWWWDEEEGSRYIERSSNNCVSSKSISVENGEFTIPIKVSEYGRYYITAEINSGHKMGMFAYFGSWSEYKNDPTILMFETDKQKYTTGEPITVTFPSEAGSTAIVTLENGTLVLDYKRVKTEDGKTSVTLKTSSEMCPNVYVCVSLIQSQKVRANDHPIRLFGVRNIIVDAPELHLYPEIKMPQELRPNEEFSVTVSEKAGKPMSYTIAIVDEGLLAISAFKTPSPFPAFYAREALGVLTWDFYDYIYGAYGSSLESAFAIGGDEALKLGDENEENRFKSVVLFKGPFSIGKNGKMTHKFTMPHYLGEVRTMVVAASDNGCYGSSSVQTPVRTPLMISMTAPRTFSPGDTIKIPVSAISMDNKIKNASVTLNTDNNVELIGNNSQKVTFNGKGDKLAVFTICVKEVTGETTLSASVSNGTDRADEKLTAKIRVPNPLISITKNQKIPAGESVSANETIKGIDVTAQVEVSSIPSLNINHRLDYLLRYPHGCSEQITSGAFPQLAIGKIINLTSDQQTGCEDNVRSVIARLPNYQTSSGGFSTWTGGNYINEWTTCYVTHFLLSAVSQGYNVPEQMKKDALKYIQNATADYREREYYYEDIQGYRLYVLALAGQPQTSMMNRFKEQTHKNQTSSWLLAAAYAKTGHTEIAHSIIDSISYDWNSDYDYNYSYSCGSLLRDKAIALIAYTDMKMQDKAYNVLTEISKPLSEDRYLSTQTTSFSLVAAMQYINEFIGNHTKPSFSITFNDNTKKIDSDNTVWKDNITLKDNSYNLKIENESDINLYLQITTQYSSLIPLKESYSKGISMSIEWKDSKGNIIYPSSIQQGTDIYADIIVTNIEDIIEHKDLALSFIVPSGFEIINDRLTGNNENLQKADYADIRDDRYYIYFSLKNKESKSFRIRMNAAFAGNYLRPAILCSDMYKVDVQAVYPGGKTRIY